MAKSARLDGGTQGAHREPMRQIDPRRPPPARPTTLTETDRDANVPETMCTVSSDGSARPMSEVLEERAALVRQCPARERAAAARVRAGMVAELGACTCSWPLVIAETTTGHEEWCTAHVWQTRAPTLSRARRAQRRCAS